MISEFLKLICIYLFCIFFCLNFINLRKKLFSNKLYIVILSIILATLSFITTHLNASLKHIIPVTLLWLLISFILSNPQVAFIVIIISFTISYSLHATSSAIAIFLLTPLYYKTNSFPFLLLSILTGFMQNQTISKWNSTPSIYTLH